MCLLKLFKCEIGELVDAKLQRHQSLALQMKKRWDIMASIRDDAYRIRSAAAIMCSDIVYITLKGREALLVLCLGGVFPAVNLCKCLECLSWIGLQMRACQAPVATRRAGVRKLVCVGHLCGSQAQGRDQRLVCPRGAIHCCKMHSSAEQQQTKHLHIGKSSCNSTKRMEKAKAPILYTAYTMGATGADDS